MTTDYKLSEPITRDEFVADAIVENQEGEWLAEIDTATGEAMPITDEDGDYIPAPRNWKTLVEQK